MHTKCGTYKLVTSKLEDQINSHYSFQQGDDSSHKVLITCSSVGLPQLHTEKCLFINDE